MPLRSIVRLVSHFARWLPVMNVTLPAPAKVGRIRGWFHLARGAGKKEAMRILVMRVTVGPVDPL